MSPPENAGPCYSPEAGVVSLIGGFTTFVSDTALALVEDGALLGSRQLDMGNSVRIFSSCPDRRTES